MFLPIIGLGVSIEIQDCKRHNILSLVPLAWFVVGPEGFNHKAYLNNQGYFRVTIIWRKQDHRGRVQTTNLVGLYHYSNSCLTLAQMCVKAMLDQSEASCESEYGRTLGNGQEYDLILTPI